MKTKVMLVLSFLYFFSFFYTKAAECEGRWKYYTDCNSIGVIAAKGDYIWCATTSGIVRWNRHDKTYIHEVYSSPEGCCWYQANNMTSLAVDSDGTAWFGNGYRDYQSWLFSFDGSDWKTYTMENSSLPGGVTRLDFDHDGLLWMSSANGSASFDGAKWMTYTNDSDDNGLERLLGVDNNNVKWFLTGSGISAFDGSEWKIHTVENGLPEVEFSNMDVDSDNVLWFTVNSQMLVSFDGTSWNTHQGLEWIPLSIAVDKNDTVWCGWKDGLASYDGSNWTYYTTENSGIPDNGIRAIAFDDDGVMWISNSEIGEYGLHKGRGLTRFDGVEWEVWQVDGPEYYHIYSVAVDHNNIKWFGTWEKGLSSFDGREWKTYAIPDTTTVPDGSELRVESMVLNIAEDHDNILWLKYHKDYMEYGNNGHRTWYKNGVMSFDGSDFTDYPDEETGFSPGYKTIAVDQNNVKWFDTTSFDGTTWKTYSDDGARHSISGPVAVDNNNLKWFGASGGVVSFDGNNWEHYEIENIGNLRQIAVDTRNVKWFQPRASVTSFNGSVFEYYKQPETKANISDDMAVDNHGFKWFLASTSSGAGLLCYDDYTWTYYRDDFWLLYAAGKIAVDHDNVKWIVTHSGIASFDGGPTVEPTQVSKTENRPAALSIIANYPNPFNPVTLIEYRIPEDGFASMTIFNIRGQAVRDLVTGQLTAGKHTVLWDGKDGFGKPVSSGVYFSRLRMGDITKTRKMLLMK